MLFDYAKKIKEHIDFYIRMFFLFDNDIVGLVLIVLLKNMLLYLF